ncbi:TIR domain-containing protein [Kordiimonas lipolytica]|uniref:TIR domain-containing protein n=1 Tax=Kordiimonas lipolytica TaxID=1662421 RepID=A0ABV8UCD4_9PROT|nr:TIR domain-containing protein [Kordiimonas lipolytica]
MAYRNGTYIAFDGLGQTDPSKSDFRYYSTIQAWSSKKHIEFKFVNSHEKTYAVRDSSQRSTLESRIRERLAKSKNCLVILSDKTRSSGSMLSYEIEQAVDRYELPLIITYPGFNIVSKPILLKNRWPEALTERVHQETAYAIHIPFKKGAILDSISQFTVHANALTGPLNFYSAKAHSELGCT